MKSLFLFILLTPLAVASPWPMGEDRGYAALVYGQSEYHGAVFGKTRRSFRSLGGRGEGITNESVSLYAYYGLSERNTLILDIKHHNIGAFPLFQAPAYEGLSDTYVGLRHTYSLGEITRAVELGVLVASDYPAGKITAPGNGTEEIRLGWHWAQVLDSKNSWGFGFGWHFRNNLKAQWTGQLNFDHSFTNRTSGSLFVAFSDVRDSGVDILGPGFQLPPNTNFHQKDERIWQGGIGISHRLSPSLELIGNISWQLDAENSDAAEYSTALGLATTF